MEPRRFGAGERLSKGHEDKKRLAKGMFDQFLAVDRLDNKPFHVSKYGVEERSGGEPRTFDDCTPKELGTLELYQYFGVFMFEVQYIKNKKGEKATLAHYSYGTAVDYWNALVQLAIEKEILIESNSMKISHWTMFNDFGRF